MVSKGYYNQHKKTEFSIQTSRPYSYTDVNHGGRQKDAAQDPEFHQQLSEAHLPHLLREKSQERRFMGKVGPVYQWKCRLCK